jgi:hypothetical protein
MESGYKLRRTDRGWASVGNGVYHRPGDRIIL